MADVFISYSRRDKEFVLTLHEALRTSQRDTWVDWQDIPLTADWWNEIERGIEGSDTFIFVLSPDSTSSEVCNREINHAVANHKRLFPVVRRDVDMSQVHPDLKRHNWLFFRETDDFDDAFRQLTEAIATDLAYVRAHTRLTVRAHEWDSKDRKDSFLLRGDDLQDAEQWLVGSVGNAQQPTELQREYILNSRKVEDANQRASEILKEAAERGNRRTRIGAIAMLVGLAIAGVSGVFALQTTNAANQKAQIAQIGTRLERAGAAALNLFEREQIPALIAAIRTGKELQALIRENNITRLIDYPAASPLLALQNILNRIQQKNILQGHEDEVISVSFSPNGQRILTASDDGTTRLWDLQGRELLKLQGHEDEVYRASFSPDGQHILTASEDNTARVWDLQGRELLKLQGHEFAVRSANFSPDGQRILTASYDGTARVWAVEDLDQLLTSACDWVRDYLTYNPAVSESDAALCGISRE
jgi:WD40 repeat protein